MFQRDYILRMIEMMGNLARRVAELTEQLEYLHMLDDESRRNCGMPLKALEELSFESLSDMLGPEPRLYASELLFLRANERHTYWEQKESYQLKSLRLLASLTEEGVLCELRAPRLAELKAELLPLLTAEDLFACAVFFSQGGAYNEMEDALFQAVEREKMPGERYRMARQGADLLMAASEASEAVLALCGMTGEELQQAARELIGLA